MKLQVWHLRGISVPWRLHPRSSQNCPSQTQAVDWSGIAVVIIIFVYILHLLMCPVLVDVYHGMASLPTLSLAVKYMRTALSEAILVLLIYCNKDILLKFQQLSFNPGDQKAVNRIHSTSPILRWQKYFA